MIPQTTTPPVDLLRWPGSATILSLVAARRGLSPAEIKSKSQFKAVVAARNEAMRMIYTHTQLTSTQIGRAVCRDHATVLYALGLSKKGREMGHPRVARGEFSTGYVNNGENS